MVEAFAEDDLPALTISSDKVCYLIVKAREFDAKDEETESDSGSNPSDDRMIAVLDETGDDPVEEELTGFIDALGEDEQIDLVAMTWLGRGDGGIEDWNDIRQQAADEHNQHTSSYLLGIPLLPDYLESALEAFGQSCEGVEAGHL